MPNKPLTFCRWAGCDKLTADGYCEEHKPMQAEKEKKAKEKYLKSRGKTSERGYDARWQKVRQIYITRNPLCEMCLSKQKVTSAVLVHHIKPIRKGGEIYNIDNLMSLCQRCHDDIHLTKKGIRR